MVPRCDARPPRAQNALQRLPKGGGAATTSVHTKAGDLARAEWPGDRSAGWEERRDAWEWLYHEADGENGGQVRAGWQAWEHQVGQASNSAHNT